MEYQGDFDFFYGKESERYHYITIPKLLLEDGRFQSISAEAKLLYGCLLDRNALSQRNGWIDEQNRVYIIYTVKEMQRSLHCGTEKVSKVLKELEGIGLVYRKRRGNCRANLIYVMDYMAFYRKSAMGEFRKSKIRNFDNRKSGISETENQEFRFPKTNKPEQEVNQKKQGRARNAFCDFHQRDYDYEELEQLLLRTGPQG